MNILIVGSMHVGNIGDNLLGIITREIVRESFPDATIRIENSSRYDLVEWADAVILGPGGVIDDVVTSNVENYMKFLRRAQERNILNMMIGVGVQRLKTATGKRICKEVLSRADFVSVRSPGDAKVLNEIGVKTHVYALQDMAFILHDKKLVRRIRQQMQMKGYISRIPELIPRRKPRLGFSLMNWDFSHVDRNKIQPDLERIAQNYTDYIMEHMGTLTKTFEVFLICQSADDIPLYERLAERYKLQIIRLHERTLEKSLELYDAYKHLDFVMTGRFHGLIMSVLTHRPVVNISIGNHKQTKMITQDLPSLQDANFSLEQLYEEDLFTRFVEWYKARKVPTAAVHEVTRCAQLAGLNRGLLTYYMSRPHRLLGEQLIPQSE